MKHNPNPTGANDQDFIKKIMKGLQEATPHVDQCIGSSLVLAIGMTGRGKSTLTRYLMGAPLFVKSLGVNPLTGTEQSYLEHPVDATKSTPVVGQTTMAQTTYPAAYPIGKPYLFSDTGGLLDNRGKTLMTVVNLANDMMIRNVKHIKGIVVVVDAKDLSDRAVTFTETLSNLWSMFKTGAANVDTSWQASVRLTVSKLPVGATAESICSRLQTLYRERKESEQTNPGSCPYLPLLKAFAEHPERIFCFPAAAAKTRDCANRWLASLDAMPGIDKSLIAEQASLRDHSHLALAVGGECAQFNRRFTAFDLARKELASLQESHSAKEEELATAKAEKEDIKKKKAVDRKAALSKLKIQKKRLDKKLAEAKEEQKEAKTDLAKVEGELSAATAKLNSTPVTKEIPGGSVPVYGIPFMPIQTGTRELPPITVPNEDYMRAQGDKNTAEMKKVYKDQEAKELKRTVSGLSDQLDDIEAKLEFLNDNPDADDSSVAGFFNSSLDETIKRLNSQLSVLSRKIRQAKTTVATNRAGLVAMAPSCRLILKLDQYLGHQSLANDPAARQTVKLLQTDPDMQNILGGLHDTSHEPARASTHGTFASGGGGGGGAKPKAKAKAKTKAKAEPKAKPSTAPTP